jgi:hypothetical protein
MPPKQGQTNCITAHHSINFSHKHTDHLGSTQYEVAIKIEILGSHCCRTAVVALDTTDSDNAVGALRNSVRQQELELPDLVPAQLHTGQVVPLKFHQGSRVRIQIVSLSISSSTLIIQHQEK